MWLSTVWSAGDFERPRVGQARSGTRANHRHQEWKRFIAGRNFEAINRLAPGLNCAPAIEHLRNVCERWIYSSALVFALSADEQQRSGFNYQYSVFQLELSRNLLFKRGATMDEVYQKLIDRTRAPLDLKQMKTILR